MTTNNSHSTKQRNDTESKVTFIQSVRTRVLLAVTACLLLFCSVFISFVIHKFKHQQQLNAYHEGRLLADSIHIAISNFIEDQDAISIHAYLDQLSTIRKKSDFEINVAFLKANGEWSEVIASNNPDNLESTDEELHSIILSAIKQNKVLVSIELEGEGEKEQA
jgi:hypothetical protein